MLASKTTAIVGLQNDGLVSLENNGLVDKINKYYDHHDGLIAIDKDNYNNDGLVDLDNDNDCLVDPNNDNDSLVSLNRDGLVGYEYEVLIGDVLVSVSYQVMRTWIYCWLYYIRG